MCVFVSKRASHYNTLKTPFQFFWLKVLYMFNILLLIKCSLLFII